jgi:hypothetical protein
MPNNDQPTLSAEQMAEVRAAVLVLSREIGDYTWDREDVYQLVINVDEPATEAVATVLNAAPALLALADEAVRLKAALKKLIPFAEEHVALSYRDADVPTVMNDSVLKQARQAIQR